MAGLTEVYSHPLYALRAAKRKVRNLGAPEVSLSKILLPMSSWHLAWQPSPSVYDLCVVMQHCVEMQVHLPSYNTEMLITFSSRNIN